MHIFGEFVCCADNKGKVRVAGFAQRGRHTDAHGVQFFDGREVTGGDQFPRFDQFGHGFGGNIQNVTLPLEKRVHFALHGLDPGDGEAGFGKYNSQRQANIAQSQDTDLGGLRLKSFYQLFFVVHFASYQKKLNCVADSAGSSGSAGFGCAGRAATFCLMQSAR